ncbi:MAG: tRNA (adenosine(37)-N6)-threonylcarbamoyltransferase complex transferase subunit TsaD [Oscillospiraceae bacterium]|nr:tRNA (adenosine(37)-N6)-threonylcarbamoyltransferase complex transferase subunit TsaD [Oscillospiraceae bacterium]
MLILGIESSCDETAAAVAEDGRCVLSSVVASQVDAHRVYGGVVPEIASRMHVEAVSGVVREALRQAGTDLERVGAIAVTHAPGLVGALLVGISFAKGLAFALGKPLVPVHHLRAHVAANYLSHADLEPPFLCLIVSGGHTQLVDVTSYTSFRVVGRTRDDAAGECLDKTARALGLPYPGGVHLDKTGQGGDSGAFAFPRPKLTGQGEDCYDFSFSGLKTAALLQIKKQPLNTQVNTQAAGQAGWIPDFAASFQYAVADYLCGNAIKAARALGRDKLALAGGVCANSVLRGELRSRCRAAGLALYSPELAYCGDNAAMVAAQGYYEYRAGHAAGLDLNAAPSLSME